MTAKFISLATAIVSLGVFLRSQLYSSDPLFLFASNKLAVNVGLVILAALAVAVSFMEKFRHWVIFVLCAVLAVMLGTLGITGTFFSNFFSSFPNILLPLDYLFLLEAGVVFGLCALSYEHQKIPYRLPRPDFSFPKFVFPVPKIPSSPKNGLGRSTNVRKPA